MSVTPLFSVPVQESSRKRLCFDISPMASDGFEKDVDLLLKDEALPRHLRTDIATLLEDRKLLGTALNRNRELLEEIDLLRKENVELRNSLCISQASKQTVKKYSSFVT
ncbi:hypothetical protein Aduo_003769 [Ancylostoma duodenale]